MLLKCKLRWLIFISLFSIVSGQTSGNPSGNNSKSMLESENYLKQYFAKISSKILQYCQAKSYSTWSLNLNPEDTEIQEKNVNSHLAYDDFLQQVKAEISKYSWKSFKDVNLKKHIECIYDSVPLPNDKLKKFVDLLLTIDVKKEIVKSRILDDPENVLDDGLPPKVYFNKLFQKNKQDWKKYFNSLGKQFKSAFPEFLQSSKEYLKNTFVTTFDNSTTSTQLLYNEIQVELKNLRTVWDEELSSVYEQLHGYIRGTLKTLYGRYITKVDQLIPISIIGGLESWLDVYSDSIPFENSPSRDDITDSLVIKLNVSTVDMFREVEEYFISINLPPMPPKFWTESIFDKPEDKELICDNTLQPFCYQNDSRLIECDGVNYFTLAKAYASLGTAKLYMMTKNMNYLPIPELDEVVIEALNMVWTLFGSSPERFRRMYLLEPTISSAKMSTLSAENASKKKKQNSEISTNFQHLQALYILPDLANIISTQTWFWNIYNGNTSSDDSSYNCEYWKLRAEFEGVEPPIRRNKNHFDPFFLMNVQTYKQFQKMIGYILAFQLHKSLCITAGEYEELDANPSSTTTTANPRYIKYPKMMGGNIGKRSNGGSRKPLRNCDITDSKAVGTRLRRLAKSGALSDWKKTLKFLTGSDELNTGPMMEYFKPYYNWLVDTNKKSRFPVGWKIPKGKPAASCYNV